MGPLAVNEFQLTKKLFIEGAQAVMKKEVGHVIRISLIILGLLWAGVAIWTFVRQANPLFVVFEFVVISAVGIVVSVVLPRRRATKMYKDLTESSGENPTRRTEFYSDCLFVQAGGQRMEVRYKDIANILSTKNLLVLVTKERLGIVLLHDGYESGSEAEVLREIERYRGMNG